MVPVPPSKAKVVESPESLRVTTPEPPVTVPPARTISVSARRLIAPAVDPLEIVPAEFVKVPVPASRVIPFASPVIVLLLVIPTPVIENDPPAAVMSPEVVTAPPEESSIAPLLVEVVPRATPSVSVIYIPPVPVTEEAKVVAAVSMSLAAPLAPMPVAELKVTVVPEIFSLEVPSAAVSSEISPAVAVTETVPSGLAIFPKSTSSAPVTDTDPPPAVKTVPSTMVTSFAVEATVIVPAPLVVRSPAALWVTPVAPVRDKSPDVEVKTLLTINAPAELRVMPPDPSAVTAEVTVKSPVALLITTSPSEDVEVAPMLTASISWTYISPLVVVLRTRVVAAVSISAVEVAPIPVAATIVIVEAVIFAPESVPVEESVILPADVSVTSADTLPLEGDTSIESTIMLPLVVSKSKPPFSRSAVTVPPWYLVISTPLPSAVVVRFKAFAVKFLVKDCEPTELVVRVPPVVISLPTEIPPLPA